MNYPRKAPAKVIKTEQKKLMCSKKTSTKSSGRSSSPAQQREVIARAKSIDYFAILLPTGILAESKDQQGPMLFSDVSGAESELQFHPRHSATIVKITLKYENTAHRNRC